MCVRLGWLLSVHNNAEFWIIQKTSEILHGLFKFSYYLFIFSFVKETEIGKEKSTNGLKETEKDDIVSGIFLVESELIISIL